MPVIIELRTDIEEYIKKHRLTKKWEKSKKLFENNPSHPSLNTELLEPKHRLIYSFRIDRKYRASCLIRGFTKKGRLLHALCSKDPLWIITSYDPSLNPDEWDENFKKRRKKP